MDRQVQLLDLIYETVTEPGLWVTVMERIADSLGGNSGWMSRISVVDGGGSGLLARIDPAMPPRYLEYYGQRNFFAIRPNPREYMSRFVPRVTTERDYLPREALARNEYYHDFMLSMDVASVLIIDLASKDLDISSINIHRGAERDPFGPEEIAFANSLYPHLVRAYNLGGLFSAVRERGDGTAAALDRLAQGVVILDAGSRIRHANQAASRLLSARNGLGVVDGRLAALHPVISRKFEALVGAAASPDPDIRRGGSIKVAFAGGSLSVAIAPLHAAGLPVFTTGPAVLVTISDTRPDEAILASKLEVLFALTGAEICVALALLGGATPRSAAELFGVSVNTIRSQMAGIFGKTGTAGQPELSRLMLRLASQP